MAAGPRRFADLEVLDWLAELDQINNIWDDEDVVAEEGNAAEDNEGAAAVNINNGDDGVVIDADSEDDGIVADAADEDSEMEMSSKYLRRGNPMSGLYCTTMTYVVIEATDGEEYYLCQGCYISYQQRVDVSYHRHIDFHTTTQLSEVEREYCKCCRDPMYLIRPLDVCNICNSNKKRTYSL